MNTITRRNFLNTLAGGAALTTLPKFAAGKSQPTPTRKPNIIFILADDLGYGDVGCYGQKIIKTPNINQLAAEGTRFTDCYAGSTVCAPSRCCLMTGFHTGHAFIRGNQRIPLPAEQVTVAEVLKQAGYTTGIVGKWGLGEPGTTGIPNRQGFDYWFGYLNQGRAHNYYPEYLWRNEEKYLLKGNQGNRKEQYSHDLFTKEALSFIARNKDKPFFLYLAYTIPHANNELGRETGNGMEVPSDEPYSTQPWPQQQKNHAAMITRMDRDIGKLMALLKKLGIDNDTVVFFSSDNGPHREGGAKPEFFDSNGPLRGIKRDLYEGGIRVPGIVRWPGKVKARAVRNQVWSFWDFPPTAAEIAGATMPENIDGISMLPALLGRKQTDHEFLYWEFHERGLTQAVRMGDWKAVRSRKKPQLELYNLKHDMAEQHDSANKHPDIVAKIETYLKTARIKSPHWG